MFVAPEHGRIRLCAFTALVAGVCLSAACASVDCPPSTKSPSAQVVEVVHVEEGDGPTTWTLAVYADGMLELTKLGKRPLCRQTPASDLQALIDLVGRREFQDVAEFDGFLGHQEWMKVTHRSDVVRRFVAEDLPAEMLSVFVEVDRLFTGEFGQKYDWPLVGTGRGSPRP